MILPNSKVAILALFGFAAVEVQGDAMGVGTCAAVAKGDSNSAAGVWFPIGEGGAEAKKGEPAPQAMFWCPGCSMVSEVGTAAPSAGQFWTDANADPMTVAEGDKAPAAGLFCPTGKMCRMVAKGTKAEEAGYAFTLGDPSNVKETGTAAPGVGMFCPGCMINEAGDTAEVSGHWWASASADPLTVPAGTKADKSGFFCPCASGASGGGSGDSSGGSSADSSGGYDYTDEQKQQMAAAADQAADAAEAEQAKAEKELEEMKAAGTASDADIKKKEAEVEAKKTAAEGMRTTADKAQADAEGDKKGSEADAAVPVAHATIFTFVACAMSLLAQC